jgi:hypothetical protein
MKIEESVLLLLNTVNSGLAKAVAQCRVISPVISKAEAQRISESSNVNQWLTGQLNARLTAPEKSSKRFLERTKPNSVAAAGYRCTFLPMANGKL